MFKAETEFYDVTPQYTPFHSMAASRAVFVYVEQLKKGFVTRLTQDQKFEKVYGTPYLCRQRLRCGAEQVTELFLKETEYEVDCIELMDSRPATDWIVPPFLRVKGAMAR